MKRTPEMRRARWTQSPDFGKRRARDLAFYALMTLLFLLAAVFDLALFAFLILH